MTVWWIAVACDARRGAPADSVEVQDTDGRPDSAVETDVHETDLSPDTDDDGFDPERDILVDWGWPPYDDVTIVVRNQPDLPGFFLGMAETASGGAFGAGWWGEEPPFGGHSFDGNVGVLRYVDTTWEQVDGETTLFDAGLAFDIHGDDRLTYLLEFRRQCFIWGHQPEYFAYYDCTILR